MNPHLGTPREATNTLSALLAPGNEPVRLSVREDICFPAAKHLDLGTISLRPEPAESANPSDAPLRDAIDCGFYQWDLPAYEDVEAAAFKLLEISEERHTTQQQKAREALRSVASALVRVGLLHPAFDADAVANFPFTRPTTVVSDTSSVIHGGLDFVVRFLCPMARVKLPAIVHMELLNAADGYLKHRRQERTKLKKGEALLSHTISQGGQRVLLRLELHTDTEIERTSIFSDPLRNAFHPDKETDANALNLSAPIRGYCDRLILEAARQHESYASPGHPVIIMTSDQGFARMALAEGIQPLFHEVPKPKDVFGRTLTGTVFNPFNGELYGVPLVSLLWELAVAFGSARLSACDGSRYFQVSAIGETLSWQPFHSKEDLLWFEWSGANAGVGPPSAGPDGGLPGERPNGGKRPHPTHGRGTARQSDHGPLRGSYKFSTESMLRLLCQIAERSQISESQASAIASVKLNQFGDYRNFLLAGGLAHAENENLVKTDALDRLWAAVKTYDLDGIGQGFLRVRSFSEFVEFLKSKRPAAQDAVPVSSRALSTYIQLAEISGLAVPIYNEGIFHTPQNPPPSDFVDCAMTAYEKLVRGEPYVLTGAWLEALIRDSGIHPVRARDRLSEARAAGLIERFTQGATPDTRFERHVFRMIDRLHGQPEVKSVFLYHGDFLIPGKASVSIRLERKTK
ncbi:MAG TPA: hypothetical protein VIK18_21045 [Pirellulales bacterium]